MSDGSCCPGRREASPAAVVVGADLPGRRGLDEGWVEVVERRRRDEGLGELGDPPDEVGAPIRIELGEDVVEEQEGRAAVLGGQEVELSELECQDRGPLLAA